MSDRIVVDCIVTFFFVSSTRDKLSVQVVLLNYLQDLIELLLYEIDEGILVSGTNYVINWTDKRRNIN